MLGDPIMVPRRELPMIRAATLVLVVSALQAGCRCTPPQAPPPPVRDGAASDEGRTGGDPFRDVEDMTGVTPPKGELARIPPLPLDAELPAVAPVPVPSGQPNVVVVIGCTVRKDQLTPYGAPADVTPFLAGLAAEGTTFDDLVAAAPWTRVASTAILTGRHAVNVGMVEPGSKRDDTRLPDAVTTMAERFRALGYHTLGATANPNLRPEFGFDQGFDEYQLGLDTGWKAQLTSTEVADAALSALKKAKDAGDTRPFYLRLVVFDAHAPRAGGEAAAAPWAQEGIPARVALYREHLHRLDAGLQHLDEGLKSLGFDPTNTVFVFVADHGEGMNYPDHHGLGHGQYFGSSAVHVPWILRGPGVAKGNRVLGPASQVDVLPTVLGLLGRPLPPEEPIDGRDWSALVRGEGRVVDRPWVISDTWFGGSNRAAIFTPQRMCQQDFGSTAKQRRKGKFVAGCYDRHADPLFTEPFEDATLQATLASWRKAAEVELAKATRTQAKVDANVSEQLRILGYQDD
jgi:arylsulfatase A-like enzyme